MKDTTQQIIKEKKQYPYNQKCECGETVSASSLYLLQHYKKQNIINHGNCKLFKRHQYKTYEQPTNNTNNKRS